MFEWRLAVRCADQRRGLTRRRARRGVVLFEVLVALTILAAIGASVVAFAAESGVAVARAREAEREMRRANALLTAVSLWPRADLDRHLGDRPEGPWSMRVDRLAPTLYSVVLSDSTRRRTILATMLYRPLESIDVLR